MDNEESSYKIVSLTRTETGCFHYKEHGQNNKLVVSLFGFIASSKFQPVNNVSTSWKLSLVCLFIFSFFLSNSYKSNICTHLSAVNDSFGRKMAKISGVLLCLLILAASGFASGSATEKNVGVFELKKGDISVKLTNWGATIISLVLPDKHGLLKKFTITTTPLFLWIICWNS